VAEAPAGGAPQLSRPSSAIPAEFAERIAGQHGDAGRAWLGELPAIVESHLDRWALVPDGPALHGYVGMVLPVRRPDGSRAGLKVSWLDGDRCWEADALAAWGGRGAVRLLERDDAAGALLLEWLDPTRTVAGLDRLAAAAVVGELCGRLAVPAPPGLPSLEETASRWVEELPSAWERLGRPFDRRRLDAAVETCRELGPRQPRRLLHGNLRFGHVLRAEREPWLAIDPNGMAGDPAYEVAPLLGQLCAGLAAEPDRRAAVRARLAAFTDGAGVDLERARRWAQAYLVDQALWCRQHQPDVVAYVDRLVDLLA
jgi:streptomycin 6-kinase